MREEQNMHRTTSIFIQDVANIDCALFDASLGIIGKTWLIDIEVTGSLDENGFVCDFGELKSIVRSVVKSSLDHTLIVPAGLTANVRFENAARGERWTLSSKGPGGESFEWLYECPHGAVYPLRTALLRRSIIEQEIERLVRHRLMGEPDRVRVHLRNTTGEQGMFRYTHGIAGHSGLCQRLFHGHQSSIEIWEEERRQVHLERYIADELMGNEVHIACPNQIETGRYTIGERAKHNEPITLAYEARDGLFRARIPASKILVVEGQCSIEAMTLQIASALNQREKPRKGRRIICREGHNKGARVDVE